MLSMVALDLTSLMLGMLLAAVPAAVVLVRWQRRHSERQAQMSLQEERLGGALLAQEGLQAQLDACRDEITDLSQANSAKQGSLAAQAREIDLLQIERDNARDAAHAWNLERSAREAELRRLDARCARLES